jgi:inorganic pyrophosphatase
MMSPWENVPIGEKAPEVFNAIIEIPKGSQNKYEYDEKMGVFTLDRVLYPSYHYPLDYGFIPETRSEDGDHLDVLVIGGDPLIVGTVVAVRPVALLNMIDSGEPDAKILAVQAKNPRFDAINDLKDIEAYNPHLLKEVANFFETYKILQKKETKITGWSDAAAAKNEIKKAQAVYQSESHTH